MRADLSKLTPAPWKRQDGQHPTHDCFLVCQIGPSWSPDPVCVVGPNHSEHGHAHTDAEFIALGRNSFDAQMRRMKQGWRMYWHDGAFWIHWPGNNDPPVPREVQDEFEWQDPFTAWRDADKWYKENVENNVCAGA